MAGSINLYRWCVFIALLIFVCIYFYRVRSSPTVSLKTSTEAFESVGDISSPTVSLKTTTGAFEFFRQNVINRHQSSKTKKTWRQLVTKFVPLPLDTTGGSHALPLLAAILLTDGPILELGCGYFSTPLLHNLSVATNRYLLSVDSNKDWLSQCVSCVSNHSLHQFQHAIDWSTIGNDRQWGVVFVDNAPEVRRIHDIIKYAYRSQLIVLHDSESSGYLYDKAALFFPYRYQYRYLTAYTDVWSTTQSSLINNIRSLLELTIKWQLPYAIKNDKNTKQTVPDGIVSIDRTAKQQRFSAKNKQQKKN